MSLVLPNRSEKDMLESTNVEVGDLVLVKHLGNRPGIIVEILHSPRRKLDDCICLVWRAGKTEAAVTLSELKKI